MTTGTYGELQNRIADELGQRGDLLSASSFAAGTATITLSQSPIQAAINTAIAKYERVRFYFNELTYDAYVGSPWFTTGSGTEFYGSSTVASIKTVAHIDKLHILISGNRYFMKERTWQYLTDVSINGTVTGQPVDYAYANYQLRFYPIPNGAYPVGVFGTQRLASLVNSPDTNAWTQDAEALIRCEAKADIYENLLQQPDLAMNMRKLVEGDPATGWKGYFYNLKSETARRSATRSFRPSYF